MALVQDDDVATDVKRTLLTEDLQLFRNTRFKLQAQYAVRERIHWSAEQLAPILKELDQMQQAITLLEQDIAELG